MNRQFIALGEDGTVRDEHGNLIARGTEPEQPSANVDELLDYLEGVGGDGVGNH